MDFVQVFRRVFLACIPHDRGRLGPCLRSAPGRVSSPHLLRLPCEEISDRNMRPHYFDPRTFVENSEERRMLYYPREASPFCVEVVISKGDEHIETRKYLGEELVCQAFGPDFQEAMIHTTTVGLSGTGQVCETNSRPVVVS
jgi:hypothetical protein